MEECRNIPGNVDRIFNVSVRARACACDPLVFARLSENVLAVETLIRRVFWPHGGTYETVHCAELELHRDILSFPTLRRVNTFPPEHWSRDPVTALSHLLFLSLSPPLFLAFQLVSLSLQVPCPCSVNYNHNYQKAQCLVIQGRGGVFVWSIAH